jgi:hypothetical protein
MKIVFWIFSTLLLVLTMVDVIVSWICVSAADAVARSTLVGDCLANKTYAVVPLTQLGEARTALVVSGLLTACTAIVTAVTLAAVLWTRHE